MARAGRGLGQQGLGRGGRGRGRRQARVHHRQQLALARAHAHQVEPQLARAPLHQALQAPLALLGQEPAQAQLGGQQARAGAGPFGVRLAQPHAQGLGGRQQPLHVHVEPAVDRLLDQVAAHQHQQHRGGHGHEQEDPQQAHAEARPQHAAALLHDHLDQVAAEHEQQHQQQGDVEHRQPVQQHRGQEVRGEVAALAQQQLDGQEQGQGPGRGSRHQAGVVAQRRAAPHVRPPGPAYEMLVSSSPLRVAMNWSTSLKSR